MNINSPYTSRKFGDRNLFKRVHGVQAALVVGENIIDFSVPLNHGKFTAIEVFGGETLDNCDFIVLDSPTGIFSGVPNLALNQFGYTANIAKDYYIKKSSFEADVYVGMIVRLRYYSISAKNIGINYDMDEVK